MYRSLFPKYNPVTHFWKFFGINMLSGGLAGATSLFFLYPLQLVRTKLALDVSTDDNRMFPGFECITSVIKQDGILGLYRGYGMSGVGKMLEPVSLGYSEGDVVSTADLDDPFLCKLGGKPIWLDRSSSIPSHSIIMCACCSSEMVLLVQTYVPLDGSPFDRTLYIWACNRRACSGKPGAVKAIRAHILNIQYALELVKCAKGARKLQSKDESRGSKAGGSGKQLDFGSVWNNSSAPLSTTSGAGLFTGPLFGKAGQSIKEDLQVLEPKNGISDDVTVLEQGIRKISIFPAQSDTATEIARVEWPEPKAAVGAKYLSFELEYLKKAHTMDRYRSEMDQALLAASAINNDLSSGEDQFQPLKSRKASQKEAKADEGHEEWTDEKYEQAVLPKGTDSAFSRFATVVAQNPAQVIRYQHGGIPLLYSLQDSAARTLVAKGEQSQKILLKPQEKHLSCRSHQHQNCESGDSYNEDEEEDDYDDDDDDVADNGASCAQLSQRYTTENLPRCPACSGRRIFECQLMPALLTELPLSSQTSTIQKKPHFGAEGSNQNRFVGSQLLHSFDLGVEFGTIMVFVCENDCHGGKTGVDYLGENAQSMAAYASATYYEELVLVQQETHVD
ncbi:hypothetical protein IWW48_000138 [Coemansia sp. RSA 1200]|nr:hypothetical protein IWW48_000138 [Coemansia sp. RSA 1200]